MAAHCLLSGICATHFESTPTCCFFSVFIQYILGRALGSTGTTLPLPTVYISMRAKTTTKIKHFALHRETGACRVLTTQSRRWHQGGGGVCPKSPGMQPRDYYTRGTHKSSQILVRSRETVPKMLETVPSMLKIFCGVGIFAGCPHQRKAFGGTQAKASPG